MTKVTNAALLEALAAAKASSIRPPIPLFIAATFGLIILLVLCCFIRSVHYDLYAAVAVGVDLPTESRGAWWLKNAAAGGWRLVVVGIHAMRWVTASEARSRVSRTIFDHFSISGILLE